MKCNTDATQAKYKQSVAVMDNLMNSKEKQRLKYEQQDNQVIWWLQEGL